MPDLNFKHFTNDGDEAARARFDSFTLALVKTVRTNVRGVRPAPGDWGIDAFVGDLSGSIAIWQAKFFPLGIDASQQDQVRSSYKSAKKAAADNGHSILGWTLVVPIELSAKERKWWDGWSSRQAKADGITTELWDLSDLQELLRTPEAADVRAEYFPHLNPVHSSTPPSVVPAPIGAVPDDLLFLKQLRAGNIDELDVASEQFYNAEILERDLADKRLERQMAAYAGLRADLRGTWADRFNHHCNSVPSSDDRLPGLHPDVMDRIDRDHHANPMHPIPLTKTHRKGAMHQVVEAGLAGWTRGYKRLVEAHRK